ncbi:MAG: hypothetical protein IK051_07950 [Rhodocyclaceae bacterium]|nr:hypothetical protein [Rhodocyclaceae bacterium]
MTNPTAEALLAAADALCARLDALCFTPPATHVYNPLVYARDVHARWLRQQRGHLHRQRGTQGGDLL